MDIFSVFTFLGGLALFLYGMNVLGAALEKQSGGRFERILERLTSSPVKGVLVGAAVTALIQSSSATTVMVVGFVNSGIMQLHQAIGIIMGANVGTTITSWILSLTGIQGDSFFMTLLKPSSFSPVLAFLGIVLIMFARSGKKKDIGTILVGFAILMFGMDTMTEAVKPLAEIEGFSNLLVMFENPILGILAGAVVTGIIQSSSASVGILQALSVTGSITYSAAIPIIMGQNIGTCVTALLSSAGTNKNAKRAAFVHLYFNIIGTVVVMVVFYALNAVFRFAFLEQPIGVAGIAVVHTLFNVICTFLLLPFTKQLEALARKTIKGGTPGDQEFQLLDERFFATPAFAVQQCRTLAGQMASLAREALFLAMGLMRKFDASKARAVREMEDRIDLYEDKLGSYLVKLSSNDLTMEDSREVSRLLHSIGDFERIGDHALNILQTAEEIEQKKVVFSSDAAHELYVMFTAVQDIVNLTVSAFEQNDTGLAKQVEPLEQVIDLLKIELKNNHVTRLQKGECTTEMGFIFSDIINNYERVADHCSNLAVSILQLAQKGLDAHAYLNTLKNSGNKEYMEKYEQYKIKYSLT